MSDVVQVKRSEWETFMKESDRLIERYDTLLKKVRSLEDRNMDLERKLQASESEQVRLREQLAKTEETSRSNIEEAMRLVRKRLATIENLLKESEGLTQ